MSQALKLDPKSYDVLVDSAQLAAQLSRWEEMVSYLIRADDVRPGQSDVLQKLSLALLRTGHRMRAVAAARRLLAADPVNPDNSYVFAYTLAESDLEEEAAPIARNLVQMRPRDAKGQLLLGIIDFKVGKLDEAKAALKACLVLIPDSADAHYYSALIARHEGDLALAQAELESALRTNPSYTMASVELGTIYLQIGKADEAKELLERAVREVPDVSQYHYHLALAYSRLGQKEAAKQEMEKYTKLRERDEADRKQSISPAQPGAEATRP
jgi:tetratricopeptide (TPR) repeat protein